MRVIAGRFRGSKILCLPGDETRPTIDRIKETLFNIINSRINESLVLDLFSGSGALAIECISRGATSGTLVEKNKDAVDFIKKNVDNVNCADKITIYNDDAFSFLKKNEKKVQYDIIFLDPPYSLKMEVEILKMIHENDFLKSDGIIVFEHSFETSLFENGFFTLYKEKKYKKTTLSFLQY